MSEVVETPVAAPVPTSDASSVVAGKDTSGVAEVPVAAPETPAEPETKEPQNALTQEFTDEEWASLKAFRVSKDRVQMFILW